MNYFIIFLLIVIGNIISYFILDYYQRTLKLKILKKTTDNVIKSFGQGAVVDKKNFYDFMK